MCNANKCSLLLIVNQVKSDKRCELSDKIERLVFIIILLTILVDKVIRFREVMKEPSVDNLPILDIGETLTVHQIIEKHSQWMHLLKKHEIIIDATHLNKVDVAGLQLLEYYIGTIESNHGKIYWKANPSDKLIHEAKSTGMTNLLFPRHSLKDIRM